MEAHEILPGELELDALQLPLKKQQEGARSMLAPGQGGTPIKRCCEIVVYKVPCDPKSLRRAHASEGATVKENSRPTSATAIKGGTAAHSGAGLAP